MAISESAVHEMEAAVALDSILLKDEIWDECDLGPASEWPSTLQNIAAFVLTLTHPAAVFWGSDLVMIYNEAWEGTARANLKQGKPQFKSYPENTIKALRAILEGQITRAVPSRELVAHDDSDTQSYPVMCSPVHDEDKVVGVVVQIFLKKKAPGLAKNPESLNGEDQKKRPSAQDGQKEASSKNMAKYIHHEETALDRQPFFQKFAEMLPTGLAILNHRADPLFVNHQFYDLTAHRGDDQDFKMWPETIHPDDYDRVMAQYHKAFEAQEELAIEFRAYGEKQWRMFLMRPLGDNNLQQWTLRHFGGFICALIDISSIKNAEVAQARVAKEARERKQQQERFIDMISHEIRNPLSAVLHCAEDILDAVKNGEAVSDTIPIDEIVEATRTISLCVAHQKNLVDDVLSFSKLDASMLSLAPRATKPKVQMADTLKIFQPELRKEKIGFQYSIDPLYQDLGVDWVMADLVRISQVIVNLMTNAIKFTTKKSDEKKISVRVAASADRPQSYPPNVVFFDTEDRGLKTDATGNPEWGDGDPLYILVAVKDTGIGISEENQARLFERFRQATPKTGQMYGGSGLGLNIARKLCQLHGGEIGVSSVEGEGSTFGFFFRVRRSGEPEDADKLESREVSDRLQTAGHKKPSEINEKDIPQDLKNPNRVPEKDGLHQSPPDDRWQDTAGMADRLHKQHTRSKSDEAEKAVHSKNEEHDDTKSRTASKSDTPVDGKEKSKNSGSKPRILFVEDNLINQKLLKRKIESRGFEVTTADNGQEAVDIVQARSNGSRAFDCILMDKEMPILDGNAAATEIRKFEKENSLPPMNIIGVTANVREEQQKDMTDAGMNDVIAKPFKMDDLLGKMRRGSAS